MKGLSRVVIAVGLLLGFNLMNEPLHSAAPPEAARVGTGDAAVAAQAINALGLDLLRQSQEASANALLSPYSIQTALAMTYGGAAGETHREMQEVLHFAGDEVGLHTSFEALQTGLRKATERAASLAARSRQPGASTNTLTLTVANRLFGQEGYEFREAFLGLLRETYDAPFKPLDFAGHWKEAREEINQWVEEQTRRRIRDLIPAGGLTRDTRLVLVNAIHLKAPWAEAFSSDATRPAPFHFLNGETQEVPTMSRQGRMGYSRQDGFAAVVLPYLGGDLQFLLLLPEKAAGLKDLESRLAAETLKTLANAPAAEVALFLPKFKMEPPLMRLSSQLKELGMKGAFDLPPGSANFDRMAPRRPDDYLRISEVFHKTFLELDEKGTEAAAATAVSMMRVTSIQAPKAEPIEVRADHPFLFAIQHRLSGACLFLGRMADPR